MFKPGKQDFGTLRTARIAAVGVTRLRRAGDADEKVSVLAALILDAFDDYYTRSRRIPWLAKAAFEQRDWPEAVRLSQERIAIFSNAVAQLAPFVEQALSADELAPAFWTQVRDTFHGLVADRYEIDLALAFCAAVQRRLLRDQQTPRAFERKPVPGSYADIVVRLDCADGVLDGTLVERILQVPELACGFRDLAGDSAAVAQKVTHDLKRLTTTPIDHVEVVEAGFFRNRGAYVVGSLVTGEGKLPLAIALLNGDDGIYVDAVILRATTMSHLFSSTLANFHVTCERYHELVDFLYEVIPFRPHGLHYSTIGYNHVGKLAVMEQVFADFDRSGEAFDHAPGPRGSVAIAFTTPGSGYILKVIRNTPTDQYKWDVFDGIDAVLGKYSRVHELNRSGSMLDNVIYSDLILPERLFEPEFLSELLEAASETVQRVDGGGVLFRHLIVQRRLTPLPIFLQTCTPEEAETAVIRLGQCIRNNAAINVFNKDLDGRNYGVSSLRFVYLFDYDAVEVLTDVKVRTNADRFDGEEDIPDWVFEDGIIFLPEEMEMHLRLPNRHLKRLFREAHGELMTAAYWERMQGWLREGRVPRVRTYPRYTQLQWQDVRGDLDMIPAR